jgi:hypothetical protein
VNITDEQWSRFTARIGREAELASRLLRENPRLGVTAYVMAGDILSAEGATELVRSGVRPEEALNFVGSYARFQWAVDNLPRKALFKRLPSLWSGADPDDTKPEYLALWYEAWNDNCQGALLDDKRKECPHGKLTIYRGQVGPTLGISWTLDINIARKFARTGGLRGTATGGVILRATVMAGDVMAYITGRGESEIIVDPEDLTLSKASVREIRKAAA